MLNYTAIDFETANSYRGSPCAVGLVRVRDGIPVVEQRWLMRPPEAVDHFDAFNTWIHGITEDMVANEPRWKHLLPNIVDFIGDDVVVAHNAGFDIGVIRYACAVDNIEWPEMRFLCTMVLARRALSLPSYRLPFVLDALGGRIDDHHDPLADARAVVEVVHGLASRNSVDNLDALADSVGVCIGRMTRGIYLGSVATWGSGSRLVRSELNPDADRDGYLYGLVVVFTGRLMSMTRQIAWDELRTCRRDRRIWNHKANQCACCRRHQPRSAPTRLDSNREGAEGFRPASKRSRHRSDDRGRLRSMSRRETPRRC
jgi:DNA polymerase III epsilon subunit-like protein